jgi:hypothetical protein
VKNHPGDEIEHPEKGPAGNTNIAADDSASEPVTASPGSESAATTETKQAIVASSKRRDDVVTASNHNNLNSAIPASTTVTASIIIRNDEKRSSRERPIARCYVGSNRIQSRYASPSAAAWALAMSSKPGISVETIEQGIRRILSDGCRQESYLGYTFRYDDYAEDEADLDDDAKQQNNDITRRKRQRVDALISLYRQGTPGNAGATAATIGNRIEPADSQKKSETRKYVATFIITTTT